MDHCGMCSGGPLGTIRNALCVCIDLYHSVGITLGTCRGLGANAVSDVGCMLTRVGQ